MAVPPLLIKLTCKFPSAFVPVAQDFWFRIKYPVDCRFCELPQDELGEREKKVPENTFPWILDNGIYSIRNTNTNSTWVNQIDTVHSEPCGPKPSQENSFLWMTQMPSWIASSHSHLWTTHPTCSIPKFQATRPRCSWTLCSLTWHHLSHLASHHHYLRHPPKNGASGLWAIQQNQIRGCTKILGKVEHVGF